MQRHVHAGRRPACRHALAAQPIGAGQGRNGGIWQWIENNNAELFAQALALNPTGRMATPEEVARGVVFLASPASSFTTGTNLVIDGALTKGVQF